MLWWWVLPSHHSDVAEPLYNTMFIFSIFSHLKKFKVIGNQKQAVSFEYNLSTFRAQFPSLWPCRVDKLYKHHTIQNFQVFFQSFEQHQLIYLFTLFDQRQISNKKVMFCLMFWISWIFFISKFNTLSIQRKDQKSSMGKYLPILFHIDWDFTTWLKDYQRAFS